VRGSTILDIPLQEQEWMLAELRQARPGCVLALHVLLLCAAGRTPTEIATFLFCSRTSVYRMVNAYQAHLLDDLFDTPPPKASWLSPSLRRSLMAVLARNAVMSPTCSPSHQPRALPTVAPTRLKSLAMGNLLFVMYRNRFCSVR